jgi:hypothetical protein
MRAAATVVTQNVLRYTARVVSTAAGCAAFRRTALGVGLLLSVANGANAQSADSAATATPPSANTWSARSTAGLVVMGTFTVVPDPSTGAVTGTWTLNSARGDVLAHGSWSAAKSPRGWTGAWRSIVAGNAREYSGTWTASTQLRATAGLPQMFVRRGIESVVHGAWRSDGNSGAWSIRLAQ